MPQRRSMFYRSLRFPDSVLDDVVNASPHDILLNPNIPANTFTSLWNKQKMTVTAAQAVAESLVWSNTRDRHTKLRHILAREKRRKVLDYAVAATEDVLTLADLDVLANRRPSRVTAAVLATAGWPITIDDPHYRLLDTEAQLAYVAAFGDDDTVLDKLGSYSYDVRWPSARRLGEPVVAQIVSQRPQLLETLVEHIRHDDTLKVVIDVVAASRHLAVQPGLVPRLYEQATQIAERERVAWFAQRCVRTLLSNPAVAGELYDDVTARNPEHRPPSCEVSPPTVHIDRPVETIDDIDVLEALTRRWATTPMFSSPDHRVWDQLALAVNPNLPPDAAQRVVSALAAQWDKSRRYAPDMLIREALEQLRSVVSFDLELTVPNRTIMHPAPAVRELSTTAASHHLSPDPGGGPELPMAAYEHSIVKGGGLGLWCLYGPSPGTTWRSLSDYLNQRFDDRSDVWSTAGFVYETLTEHWTYKQFADRVLKLVR